MLTMYRSFVKIKPIFLSALILFLALGDIFLLFGADGEEQTVYVTNSGKSYHREGCGSLRQSKIAVPIADAVRSGYKPCSICKPPILVQTGAAAETANPPLYRVNQAADPKSGKEGLRSYTDGDLSRMVRAEVIDHVDGDTVRVRLASNQGEIPVELRVVETVRLLWIDTPETVHPNRPVERFGKAASDFTRARLLGRTVYLAFDWDLRDRYDRLLAYIYLSVGECFNALLIQEGYAYAYTQFAFQFMDEFSDLEQEARLKKRGLWE